jgi:anthranilate synthase component 1
VDLFEDLQAAAQDPLGFPDFIFWLAESLIVFEQGANPRLVCTAFGAEDERASERAYFDAAERLACLFDRCQAEPAPRQSPPTVAQAVEVDLDDEAYRGVVTSLREHIAAGEIYQIVPSRTFRVPCPQPLGAYATLRALDPSPYRFFVSGPDHILFGASPETSVRIFEQEGRKMVEVKPIAGTRGRGTTVDEDDRLEAEMRLDHKEAAEHMMLVDLARNDVARVSVSGTRRVEKLMTVERYARVMHLVSSVTGVLRGGLDALHALQACLNVGTLTGAPKHRATQLLRETEVTKRGPYGGAIGWITGEGLMDTGVVIRSAVVKDGTAFVRAGAGVVYDSDPQAEADETRRKASALLSVLAAAGSPS